MKTDQFLRLLKTHPNKALVFEYNTQQRVQPDYHITEVKHVNIESVDCGSGTDSWQETIIQLLESPSQNENASYMSCYKALGILTKVARLKPYQLDATIKIEYGNSKFHTAQLFINDFEIYEASIVIKLAVEKTACKAEEVCGIAPQETSSSNAQCDPVSGCC
ncbi:DUF6428 family protein [Patiriisocius hiemis]|uniref:DUF6428 family protein n=1 Tax=Patiriisocius hiemis TaxID=3075604 RepID=A0ABU2YC78_9FLAO|nr:DUF6428 family protein [Constantimarinum sp. W242]MDT0555362.1 DUF6428 family protein [Constantimarinum sp. W242]